jgi:hypothetical protein
MMEDLRLTVAVRHRFLPLLTRPKDRIVIFSPLAFIPRLSPFHAVHFPSRGEMPVYGVSLVPVTTT